MNQEISASILVVEGDAQSRRRIEFHLRAAGYDTLGVATVGDAIKCLDTPRAVVLDLMLPDGSGAAVLSHIHSSARPHVPVAVVADNAEAASGVEIEGQDMLLEKPVNRKKLMSLLGWLKRLDDVH